MLSSFFLPKFCTVSMPIGFTAPPEDKPEGTDTAQNNEKQAVAMPEDYFTPAQIVEELDKYIIGQNAAKRAVAIALRNRWRRQRVQGPMRDEIMPNNIIMIGPTGVGKTEIARRLAKLSAAPFLKVEATKFTEVGYVGRDVESIVRDLTENAVATVRSEKTAAVHAEAAVMAENRILDILIPPMRKGISFDTATDSQIEENKKLRAVYLQKLREGSLDDQKIEIDVQADSMQPVQIMGPFGFDDLGINLQEALGSVMPKKSKTRKLTIAEAKKMLIQEEAGKLIDQDALIREAVRRTENSGIVFLDEIDKVASRSGGTQNTDVSREGVQRDLLPVVEGCTVTTKYGPVRTDHILFIASGAFHVSKPSDLIPELQGRFPIRVELQSLSEQDLVQILTIPENALLRQYKALMESESVQLEFTDDAISEIARIAAQVNQEVENIGARRLHTILTTLLDDILFEPAKHTVHTVHADFVRQKLSAIATNTDMSHYIL
jgi:ATP-dependent HslUV protease ATP-binding subunit HslU